MSLDHATTTMARDTATTSSPTALPATSTALGEGRDIASLRWDIRLLQALEPNIELHNRVKVLKLLAVNQDSSLDRVEGQILDPLLKVMDLLLFHQFRDHIFREGGMLVVLLHVGSTVLVKGIVLAVTTVVQVLEVEGHQDDGVHSINLVAKYTSRDDYSACSQISSQAATCWRQRATHGGWPTPSLGR